MSIFNWFATYSCNDATDATKERLHELENTRKDLQEKLIFERMQEKVVLDKKVIENYLNKAVEKEPEIMI